MKKIVIQLKKMYDQIDLRYYYKGMNKLPFLIKHQGILYGQENQYIDYSYDKKVVLNDKLYIIINNDKKILTIVILLGKFINSLLSLILNTLRLSYIKQQKFASSKKLLLSSIGIIFYMNKSHFVNNVQKNIQKF